MLKSGLKLSSNDFSTLKSKKPNDRFFLKYFSVYFYRSGSKKFGVVVPNSKVTSIVLKNKIKRLIFSKIKSNLDLFKNGHYVFVLKSNLNKSDYNEKIVTDFNSLLSKNLKF